MANIMGLSTTVENLRERNTSLRVQAEMSAHMSNGFSVIGINANHIPAMQQAIQAYVTDIKAQLEKIDSDFDPNVAFKGTDIKGSLISYMQEAKQISLNIVTYLNAFSDQLNEIKNAYERNDASNASNINDQRSSLQSSYSGAYQGPAGETAGSYIDGTDAKFSYDPVTGQNVVAYPGHPNGQ